jgi:hypothetical protein
MAEATKREDQKKTGFDKKKIYAKRLALAGKHSA